MLKLGGRKLEGSLDFVVGGKSGIIVVVRRCIKWKPRSPRVFWFGVIFTFLLMLPFLASIGYDYYYHGRVIPGVYLGAVNLGGQTEVEAKTTLESVFKEASPSVDLTLGSKKFQIYGSDFGFTYLTSETLRQALAVGRDGKPWQVTLDQLQTLRSRRQIVPSYTFSATKLDKLLSNINDQVGRPVKEASYTWSEGKLSVVPEQTGWQLATEAVKSHLLNNFATFDYSSIELPLKSVNPKLYASDLTSKQTKLQEKLLNLPKLTYEGRTWELTPEEALTFLTVSKAYQALTLSFNKSAIEKFLKPVADEINVDVRGEVFTVDANNKVTDFKPSQPGLTLQVSDSAKALGEALVADQTLDQVALVVTKQEPPGDSNSYGIKELLGEGTTNFAGSIPGRIHNIDLASSKFDGVLIKPGEEVSFNKIVGDVDAAHGYDEAYIISEGRTVLGTGGGLCQVSTTLFRAALNAGFPILERTAHAYRVHYYEPPVGIDATVYTPSVDLVFKNDSPAYILIQREIDIPSNNLTFKIYGTSDGRISTIDTPVVTNQIAPPAPLYQDDPTLPKGVVNQVDWSAWGATAIFHRKVIRGSDVLQEDTFVSVYQPWRAIYLVGTKE